MRAFNEREKDIIRLLNTIDISNFESLTYILQEQYFPAHKDIAVFVYRELKKVIIFMPESKYLNRKIQKETVFAFLELLSLIRYLMDNRYLDIWVPSDEPALSALNMMRAGWKLSLENEGTPNNRIIINNELYIVINQLDHIRAIDGSVKYRGVGLGDKIYESVVELIGGIPIVTEELRQLEKDDFRSREDVRFGKTQMWSRISVITAIVVGLFSIISSVYLMWRSM